MNRRWRLERACEVEIAKGMFTIMGESGLTRNVVRP